MSRVREISKTRKWLLKILGVILVALIVNQIARHLDTKINELIQSFWMLMTKGGLVVDLLHTLKRFGLGYIIAVLTAVPIGIVIGRVKSVAAVLDIPIELLRPIPSAVIIPLGLAFLGIGESMKVFVVWFGAFWPMLVFVRQACRHIDPILLETAQVFDTSRFRTLYTVVLPAIVPSILAAARTALAIALLLAVTVEMIAGGAPDGLGYFIIDSERSFQRGQMLVGVVILSIFGYLINWIFSIIEKQNTGQN
jgi:ABC-type nitrate/sulfonate/bicarbonate transport system permease component